MSLRFVSGYGGNVMDQYSQYLERANVYEAKLHELSECMHAETEEEIENSLSILADQIYFSQHRLEKYNWLYIVLKNKECIQSFELGLENDLKNEPFYVHEWMEYYINAILYIMPLVSHLDNEISKTIREIYYSISKELEHPIFKDISDKLWKKITIAYLRWTLGKNYSEETPSEVIEWANKIDVSHVTERRIEGEQTVWTAAGYKARKDSNRKKMQGVIIKVCKDLGFKSEHFRRYCDWCDWRYTLPERQASNQRRWEDYEVLKAAEEHGLLDTD